MRKTIAVLPGDGIGPEVTAAAHEVLKYAAEVFDKQLIFREYQIGGSAIDATGTALPSQTIAGCKQSDAVFLGAVGGPKWDGADVRPEGGLLALRKELGVFANLRPVKVTKDLVSKSPLKPEVVEGTDLLIVRELTGGIYFGQPRGRDSNEAYDTMRYLRSEIERVARVAFEQARTRRGRVTSVDKANVLDTSRLWREVVNDVSTEFPDIELEHQLVDSAAMALVSEPRRFDVILTSNLFGDILSDEAAVITGNLGDLPSASVGTNGPGLFEPIHGSAPDIAGKNIANPTGAILSTAMMCEISLGWPNVADAIRNAVQMVRRQSRTMPTTPSTTDFSATALRFLQAENSESFWEQFGMTGV
ncbi:3-isopropylmalate dehydrogenase [Planctomycetota bacterium]|nr:3-isopropylmalate dehydrogenase [Planctomycetota bacterium]